jgi:hypothetical protein
MTTVSAKPMPPGLWKEVVSLLTSGYCWPTPTCRNLCVHYAFFEGKKAEEISPRKSTPRTLKEVGQQYPQKRDDFCDFCIQSVIHAAGNLASFLWSKHLEELHSRACQRVW